MLKSNAPPRGAATDDTLEKRGEGSAPNGVMVYPSRVAGGAAVPSAVSTIPARDWPASAHSAARLSTPVTKRFITKVLQNERKMPPVVKLQTVHVGAAIDTERPGEENPP